MDKKVACVIVTCFALCSAGLIPIPSSKILEGPSTRTKIIGPDGSIIDAYAPGGKIVLEDNAGPLVQHAPVVLEQAALAQQYNYLPLELHQVVLADPVLNSIEAVAPVQQVAAADSISVEASKIARVSEDGQKVFLQPGILPRVETRDSVPITEETEETPIATTELPATTEYVTSGNADLSGAYVPDQFEKLFDDGSYRSEHY